MKLKLHNILKIEDADIEIGGLTVLTGENNSGKSTVGKILFSIFNDSVKFEVFQSWLSR